MSALPSLATAAPSAGPSAATTTNGSPSKRRSATASSSSANARQSVCWVEIPPPPQPRRKRDYIYIDISDSDDAAPQPSTSSRPRPAKGGASSSQQRTMTTASSFASKAVATPKKKPTDAPLFRGGSGDEDENDYSDFEISFVKPAPARTEPNVEVAIVVRSDSEVDGDDQGPRRLSTQRSAGKRKSTSDAKAKKRSREAEATTSSTSKAKKRLRREKEARRLEKEPSRKTKGKKVDRHRKKERSRRQGRHSDGSDDDDEDDDEVENLKSNLNEDALARSTGSNHKAEFKKRLEQLKRKKRKAEKEKRRLRRLASDDESDTDDEDSDDSRHRSLFGSSGTDNRGGSRKRKEQTREKQKRRGASRRGLPDPRKVMLSDTPSEWSSEIETVASSSSSSSSSDGVDFIVDDDHIETEAGYKPPRHSQQVSASSPSKRGSSSQHALLPNPTARAREGGILSAFGLGHARLSFSDLCALWIEWAVVRMLIPFGNVQQSDRERLERGRAQLRSKMRSSEESLTTMAMRRQFAWYLREYPKVTVSLLFDSEVRRPGGLAKHGCGACHRKSQACSHSVRFEGERYDQETLGKYVPRSQRRDAGDRQSRRRRHRRGSSSSSSSSSDDDDETSSDRSVDGENFASSDEDEKGRAARRFYVGGHCASRASVLHALHHWEWTAMQSLHKHVAIRELKAEIRQRGGYGVAGTEGPGAEDVEIALRQMQGEVARLERTLLRLQREAEGVNRLQ